MGYMKEVCCTAYRRWNGKGTVRRYADGQAVGAIRQVYRLTYRSGRVRCCRVWEGSRLAEELSRREEPPVSVAEERWKSRPEAA